MYLSGRGFELEADHKPLERIRICSRTLKLCSRIDHFTVVGLVTWSLNGSEAGVDLVLIQTSLFLLCKPSCSYAN